MRTRCKSLFCPGFLRLCAVVMAAAMFWNVFAGENVPHRPFAQWADVPEEKQFVLGLVYEHSYADHYWAGSQTHHLTPANHIDQGFFALQYGLPEGWALDLNIGYTVATACTPESSGASTSGFMDTSFGVRYQILHENLAESKWRPTLTFRAGAVVPGNYDQEGPFCPGLRSAAIAPELLLRKHFGWAGFGGYADTLFRWNRTTANDQYIIAFGVFQQVKQWEFDLGWRHLQTLTGSNIVVSANNTFSHPRDPRENSDMIEAGISYTTPVRHFRYGLHMRESFHGANADDKFWLGASVDFPFAR